MSGDDDNPQQKSVWPSFNAGASDEAAVSQISANQSSPPASRADDSGSPAAVVSRPRAKARKVQKVNRSHLDQQYTRACERLRGAVRSLENVCSQLEVSPGTAPGLREVEEISRKVVRDYGVGREAAVQIAEVERQHKLATARALIDSIFLDEAIALEHIKRAKDLIAEGRPVAEVLRDLAAAIEAGSS